METFELNTSHRTTTGKNVARSLRREGMIPAILYGPNTEAVSLAVSVRELKKILSSFSENVILKLVVDDDKNSAKMAMVKELQTVPVTQDYLHVDFYEITMDKAIKVEVPVVVTGNAKGAEEGGLVQLIRNELEVLCLPLDIPEAIKIDVTNLDIGDSVHVEDIPVSEKVTLIADTNFTVVTILAPTVEEEVEEAEEGIEEEAAPEGEAAAPEESTEEAG